MRLPRDISPGAKSRRALLADSLAAGLIAALAIVFAAGIGVVGVIALVVFLGVSAWMGVESLSRWISRLRAEKPRPRRRSR